MAQSGSAGRGREKGSWPMRRYRYDLFADYYQFYLQDEEAECELSDSWTPEAVQRLLTVASGTICIGTVRNTAVPVTVEVTDREPQEEFSQWDKVNECDLEVPSGRIVIAGCTDYFPDAERIDVDTGSYRARIYYGGLHTISEDGLEGQDHYKITLWPARIGGVKVVK